MKNLLILISLLTLASCGLNNQPKTGTKKVNIHPEAQEYVSTFQVKYNYPITNLEVVKRPLEGNVLAYCQYGGSMTPLIVLNTNYWDHPSFTTANKEQVMYHELGHCLLKRGHDDSMLVINPYYSVPASIMNTYHFSYQVYTQNYSHYINELFRTNAFAGISFDDTVYASTMPEFPEFVEPEIEVLSSEEIKDCVNVVKDEVTEGHDHDHEHNEELETVQE